MRLTVDIEGGLEARLLAESRRREAEPDDCARQILMELFPANSDGDLASVLQSFIDDGDEEEQQETFAALKTGLNESHSSWRKVFRDRRSVDS